MKEAKARLFVMLLFCSTLFLSTGFVVEKEILPKWYAMICMAVSGFFLFMVFTKGKPIHIDKLAVWVSVLVCCLIARSLWPRPDLFKVLVLTCFLFLFYIFRHTGPDNSRFFDNVIVIAAIAQGAYGLLQFFGIAAGYSGFRMVGSFDNPAGYAACLAASLPFCFTAAATGRREMVLRVVAAGFLWTCILLSGSRAGIVAAGAITAILIYKQFGHMRVRKRRIAILATAVISIAIFSVLFFAKKDSAVGRLLIWRVAAGMVAEAPVFGSGSGSFRAGYMPHQASYFEAHPDSPFTMLADNVTHPFNEYLSLAVEYGLAGLILLIVVLCVVAARVKDISNPYFLCFIAVGVFSLYSYPFRYAYVAVLCTYCLAKFSTGKPVFEFKSGSLFSILSIALTVACCWFTVKDFTFERRWKQLTGNAVLGQPQKILPDYGKLYEHWNGDPFFLYNYGAVLNTKKKISGKFVRPFGM